MFQKKQKRRGDKYARTCRLDSIQLGLRNTRKWNLENIGGIRVFHMHTMCTETILEAVKMDLRDGTHHVVENYMRDLRFRSPKRIINSDK